MLPTEYRKRSFYRFAEPIDLPRLRNEYYSIPDDAWMASYWGSTHCSVGMLLLRGGDSGTEKDFFADSVDDNPVLAQMPYIRSLMDSVGPFGAANYAFIFRMEPRGITRLHRDTIEKWKTMFRIHVPIETNPRAKLVSDGRAQHFAAGHAWSFDNYSEHGVVNGSAERVHFIMDVQFNDKLAKQIDKATFLRGENRADLVAKTEVERKIRDSYPGDEFMGHAVKIMRSEGLDDSEIAEAFNAKCIPTRRYFLDKERADRRPWDATMIADIRLD